MRILHISKYYFPYIGGLENICKYLVDGMPQHHIAVLCFNDKRKSVIEEVDGIKVYRGATWTTIKRQPLSLTYFRMMRKAIKEVKPDIIHFHWANPFSAAILLTMMPKDVKLVIHWHLDIIAQSRIYPFIKFVETALLKRANLVVATSSKYRDASVPLQPFKSKVKILPCAVDEDNMALKQGEEEQIAEIKEKYNNRKIIFFIGRHVQYKGLPYLLEAEKKVKSDCVFIIGGSGPLTKELKAQCKSSRVYFVGYLTKDEVRRYYHAASVFAFPSVTKNEAFGVALAEAMYCEVPAVTFTIPGSGTNWVCPNGICGIEVPNKDTDEYAKAIDALLCDETLAKTMGEAGKKRVIDNFTIPIMVNTMNDYYQSLME